MTILVDSDVLLDVLAEREQFRADSSVVWALAEAGKVKAVVSALSFSNVFYVGRKMHGAAATRAALAKIALIFAIAPVDASVIQQALASQMSDFEDALQAHSGEMAGATHVITRDIRGFAGGPLIVVPPADVRSLVAVT